MDPDTAWNAMKTADSERDISDFREAFKAYCKSLPDMDFKTAESAFREARMNTHLIAKEQEVSDVHTVVNLQGKTDCKYVVSFQFGTKPSRAATAGSWPKTAEENLERLEDAGYIMDRMVPKCRNCDGKLEHLVDDDFEDAQV